MTRGQMNPGVHVYRDDRLLECHLLVCQSKKLLIRT